MMNRRRITLLILPTILSAFILAPSCNRQEVPDEPAVVYSRIAENVGLPREIKAERGSSYKLQGMGVKDGDFLEFSADASSFTTPIINASYAEFAFSVTDDFVSGTTYKVELGRDNLRQVLGYTTIVVGEPELKQNIHGSVTAEGKGVKNVWVTDGVLWARTAEDGSYSLKSEKTYGYVYIVVPGGYESADGTRAFPGFWQALSKNAATDEAHNFTLKAVDNTKHRVIISADWQMRNAWSPSDVEQVKSFLSEMDDIAAASDVPLYSISLGDMTWDLFWYERNFAPSDWKNVVKNLPMPMFPVIGNHDYDIKQTTDFNCAGEYRKVLGPTYYSFNIGKVHYLMLDNIIYESDGTGAVRNTIETLDGDVLAWATEDLSHVDASTPVVVCAHVPMHSWGYFNEKWTAYERGNNYSKLLSRLKSFEKVRIFTGHSHVCEYFDAKLKGLASNDMLEYKVPALGGTLWVTLPVSGYNLTIDGLPDGYHELSVEGTSLSCDFKAVGESADYQMRTYDMNEVRKYWASNGAVKNLVASNSDYSADKLFGILPDNSVVFNLFCADPELRVAKLEVTENGEPLSVKYAEVMDPLHLVASETDYWKKNSKLPGDSYKTKAYSSHHFYVVASSSTSELEVKYTTTSGKTITEKINLPKQFKDEDKK